MSTFYSGVIVNTLKAHSQSGYILEFGEDVFDISDSTIMIATNLQHISSAFAFAKEQPSITTQTSSMMYGGVHVGIGRDDKTKIKIFSGITYTINSIFYTRPYELPLEFAFTPTTHDVAATKEAQFALSLQADGTITITKSPDADIGLSVLPDGPVGEIVCAGARISSAAAGFTAGTTKLDDADLTVTYTDYGFLPVLSSADTISTDGILENGAVTVTRSSSGLNRLSFYYILIGQ